MQFHVFANPKFINYFLNETRISVCEMFVLTSFMSNRSILKHCKRLKSTCWCNFFSPIFILTNYLLEANTNHQCVLGWVYDWNEEYQRQFRLRKGREYNGRTICQHSYFFYVWFSSTPYIPFFSHEYNFIPLFWYSTPYISFFPKLFLQKSLFSQVNIIHNCTPLGIDIYKVGE